MNLTNFFELAKESNLKIHLENMNVIKPHKLSNEALFHLPFISMVVLMMSKDRRKPNVSELGQLVGECIEGSIKEFKGSSQHLGWSANLRVRTVKALSFLEISHLVSVNNRKGKLEVTELGKKVISKALEDSSDLSYNLMLVQRSYRNICKDKQMDLEIL
ncbi:hypothetical protein [Paraglaciecola hydrolytica]|uniref:Uncharacterized protein n=1 Tax=Paraglaciecola hydrolytica TaxID=1799789 RepID=A0A135ZZI2_9ALTE|nr:hypothetical protein [Paraglaciecola hydrolytica]KXI28386.1 hypothetical protein AX660_18670 [Paraglaciecola hydrolytica]